MPDGADSAVTLSEGVVFLVALVLSAAFSGAETALTALSETRAKAIVDEGGRRGKLLRLWLDKPHHVLTATLIGDHAANTVIAVLASLVAERAFHSLPVTIIVAVMVIALLVFGEITPRSFAKTHAAAIGPTLMPLVWGAYIAFFPFVVLFTKFSHVLVRAAGGAVTRSGPFVTEDDIAAMIQLGSREGILDKQEGRMLKSVLDLGETLVREVMVPRTEISALPLSATLDEVIDEARNKGHSRMPVFDDTLDEVKGFFHTKDLLHAFAAKAENKPFLLREHLRPVLYVPELMRMSDLLKLFQKRKTHLAVVVDEYGGTAGIVAFEDVLEEIVGPIQDEHDEDETPIKKLEDGRLVAEGRASLYELGEALGVTFPADGGYETLGGFLIARTGRMPMRSDRVVFAGHTFVVRDADEKRVARVEIEKVLGAASPSSPPHSADAEVSGPVLQEPPPSNPENRLHDDDDDDRHDDDDHDDDHDDDDHGAKKKPQKPRIVKSA